MKNTVRFIGLLAIFNILKSLALELWQTLFMGKPEPGRGLMKERDSERGPYPGGGGCEGLAARGRRARRGAQGFGEGR